MELQLLGEVEMKGFPCAMRRQAWQDSLRWMTHHGPYQTSAPNPKDKYPNKRWMERRQWFLSQSLLLLHCQLPGGSLRSDLHQRLQPLIDRYKTHAGQHLDTNTATVVDDKLEADLYEEILRGVGDSVVLGDMVAECRINAADATQQVERLAHQLELAKAEEQTWQTRLLAANGNPHYIHSEATTRDSTPGAWAS